MERLDFIRELFMLYGKSADKNIDLIRNYDVKLSKEQNIDWNKMYKLVEKDEMNSLPNPKYLLSLLPSCRIEIPGQYKNDEGTSVLKLKDRFYVYDMWHNTRTIDELHNYYKNKNGDNFVWFKYYPPEFFVMGNNIYDTRKGFREPVEVI